MEILDELIAKIKAAISEFDPKRIEAEYGDSLSWTKDGIWLTAERNRVGEYSIFARNENTSRADAGVWRTGEALPDKVMWVLGLKKIPVTAPELIRLSRLALPPVPFKKPDSPYVWNLGVTRVRLWIAAVKKANKNFTFSRSVDSICGEPKQEINMYKEPRWWIAGTLNDDGLLISIRVAYRDNPNGMVGADREKLTQTVIINNWDLAESSEERQWSRILRGDYGKRVNQLGLTIAQEDSESVAAKTLHDLIMRDDPPLPTLNKSEKLELLTKAEEFRLMRADLVARYPHPFSVGDDVCFKEGVEKAEVIDVDIGITPAGETYHLVNIVGAGWISADKVRLPPS